LIDAIVAEIPPNSPVLIAGPTASGKSGLALAIARAQGGRIINADALQVYANWRLLTARPDAVEEAAAPHLLYGHVAPQTPYSVGHWLREVRAILSDPGPRPIVVGGTGLYFRALTEGLADIPPTTPEIRARADALRAQGGIDALRARLAQDDPVTLSRIDQQNPMRVQRAWEVLEQTARPLSQWQDQTAPPVLPLSQVTPLVLMPEKPWLNARIDLRFDQMMAQGALDEVRTNLPDWSPALPSSRAIGAPELIAHLRGEMPLEEAVARAKIATHQYAKRQRTWFRARMRDWRHLTPAA